MSNVIKRLCAGCNACHRFVMSIEKVVFYCTRAFQPFADLLTIDFKIVVLSPESKKKHTAGALLVQ